jgi:hypothetical protein
MSNSEEINESDDRDDAEIDDDEVSLVIVFSQCFG